MRLKLALIIIMIITLCSCGTDSVDSSFRVPELPEEFIEFNDEINKIKAEGYEPLIPNGGTNRQSVQLTDLDGDGVDEGIAFFRETGNAYKVYAYFFKKTESNYEIMAKIEGSGDTVENVTYADVLGNGNNEVIIGWGIAESGARSVSAYSIVDSDPIKLCEVNSIYHVVCDLNEDMISDLCVVYQDSTDGMQKLAIYSQKDETLAPISSAPLSLNSDTILRIRAAYAGDFRPAIFVEKRRNPSGMITDIILWENDHLENITYSEESGESEKTARTYETFCEDIDMDGTLEVPMQEMVVGPVAEGELIHGTTWYGFEGKQSVRRAYTFRSSLERWTLSLPLDWNGRCIALYHKQANSNVTSFYGYKEDGASEELFSIMAISGENREKNMEKLGYEKLLDKNGTLYCVKINKKRYLGYDVTAEMLTERFSHWMAEWSTGEVVF